MLDLRVDDHADPLAELRRLFDKSLERFQPFVACLPSRANPAGIIDRAVIERKIERFHATPQAMPRRIKADRGADARNDVRRIPSGTAAHLRTGDDFRSGHRRVRATPTIRSGSMRTSSARAAGRWNGLIASGWHTCCDRDAARVDGALQGSESFGSPGLEYLKWLAPVRPGDALTLHAEVLDVRRSERTSRSAIVRWRWRLVNQDGVAVLELVATSLFDLAQAAATTRERLPRRGSRNERCTPRQRLAGCRRASDSVVDVHARRPVPARARAHLLSRPHWCYVGLEAEIPNAGDFKRTFVGERQVIMVRDPTTAAINVVENRCAHRGDAVLPGELRQQPGLPLSVPPVELRPEGQPDRRARTGAASTASRAGCRRTSSSRTTG